MQAIWVALFAALVLPTRSLSPNCTCAEFCAGTCSDTNKGTVTTLPIFRLTPFNVTDVRDKNTGDPQGDLAFFLVRDKSLASCEMPERANTDACFLAYQPVIRRFYVDLDQRWGPYMRCNPLPFYHGADGPTDTAHVDTRHFGCFPWHGRGSTPWVPPNTSLHSSCADESYCFDLMNRSVGRDPAMHSDFNPDHPELAQYMGGWWYSTPSQAECKGDRRPGDGKNPSCSWRLVNDSVKAVNASCMQKKIMPPVIKNGKSCFGGLSAKCTSAACSKYYDCLSIAIMGCGGKSPKPCPRWASVDEISPLPPKVLVDAWNLAFEEVEMGGCPDVSAIE